MNVLIIYAHPNPGSFNAAILKTAREGFQEAGHQVRVRDLYEMKFDPVLTGDDIVAARNGELPADIVEEQEHVRWADAMVFIYPLWWYDRPAILKGWLDRVFIYGFAYGPGANGYEGLLRHNKALIIMTTGAMESWFDKANSKEVFRRTMTEGTLEFCGINDIDFLPLYGVTQADDATRQGMLETIHKMTQVF